MTQQRNRPGVRTPAEWEPHEAVWTAWPSHADLWGEDLAAARGEFAAMCAAISGERVACLVRDERGEAEASAALAGAEISFYRGSFGDIWLRDTGPVFVRLGDGGLAAVVFDFNGWGGKYVFPEDREVAGRVAKLARTSSHRAGIVLEGGALDTDGQGTFLTTRQCALNANRNPGVSEHDIERALAASLGARTVVWLDRGLANDHTDGHVDTLARFTAPGRVVCMTARDAADPNRAVLTAVAEDLRRARDCDGHRLEVVELPSPGLVADSAGNPMPASYANFYVANGSVVVPVYGTRYDYEAVDVVQACFPGRPTVGVPARAILTGGGAFHCITQQQPKP